MPDTSPASPLAATPDPYRCSPMPRPADPIDKHVPCHNHRPGHVMHQIQGGLAGRTPWFWRAGVVTRLEEHAGGVLFAVAWVEDEDDGVRSMPGTPHGGDGPAVLCWHHALRSELCLGYPLRIHDEYYLAETEDGRFSVLITKSRADETV